MKAIDITHAGITGVTGRRDRSARFGIETGELTSAEKAALMDLVGLDCRVMLIPSESSEEVVTVATERETLTQSQRLRSVLFVAWKQKREREQEQFTQSFDEFYAAKMEAFIEHVKSKLEPKQ